MVRIPTNRVPTHPGEMLLEGVSKSFGFNATRIGRRHSCSLSSGQRNGEWSPWYDAEHSPAFGKIFRYVTRVLDESPTSLGSVSNDPI